ncbi:unnamed protein product [Vitrella brassicaformis CCMP3155]|uniref:Dickkopf N-terminal cysteine-rich domain-containing protein n=1 Tax=Vitrella brassicaformis (strain CCMP3155) TaxID=1169540 RepID=A0A0G4EK27_VITBC|nr:unnamed protein product [Vitrella brassicaformis CCMP3155]|eukprot:CEL97785.1 unnamed protein product [Vitrella brassicaformis CCMP3155]
MRSSLVSPALLLLVISPAVLLPVGEVPQPPAGPFTRSLQDDESQATNGTAAPEQDSGDEEQTPTQAQSNTTRPANDTDSPQDGNKQRTNQFEQEGLDSCEDDDDCENTFHCDDRKRCVRCCTKKDKCPDGFFCGGGKCRRCREDGAECHQFDQCCSRSCTNGICGTSGTSCEGDGECGEGEICVADQCVEEPSVCLAVGDPCPFGNAQCCSRNCGGETCVCAADGFTSCSLGSCCLPNDDATCTEAGQCCTNFCDGDKYALCNFRSECDSFGDSVRCFGGRCCKRSGSCTDANDCCSGLCEGGSCDPGCGDGDDNCLATTGFCGFNRCCKPGGAPCEFEHECCGRQATARPGDFCPAGICLECVSDDDCRGDQQCEKGFCYCANDDQCRNEGRCDTGAAGTPDDPNLGFCACTEIADCFERSQRCIDNVCRSPEFPV